MPEPPWLPAIGAERRGKYFQSADAGMVTCRSGKTSQFRCLSLVPDALGVSEALNFAHIPLMSLLTVN